MDLLFGNRLNHFTILVRDFNKVQSTNIIKFILVFFKFVVTSTLNELVLTFVFYLVIFRLSVIIIIHFNFQSYINRFYHFAHSFILNFDIFLFFSLILSFSFPLQAILQ